MVDAIAKPDWKKTVLALPGRIGRLLLKPAKEFQRLAGETETVRDVFTGWILPLAIIMVLVCFVTAMVWGITTFDSDLIHLPLTLLDLPAYALPVLVQSLVMPFVHGGVAALTAGFFGGERSFVQGVRTAAYVSTPAWLVGMVSPIWHLADLRHVTPKLSLGLVIGALWSIYLLFRALPPMMKTPPGRQTLFALAAIVVIMFFAWGGALLTTFGTVSYLNTLMGSLSLDVIDP